MMEEIQIEEYVRTINGKIDIVEEISLDTDVVRCQKCKYWVNYITKHSHNIIDLIEVGDFVNGYLIDEIDTSGILIHKAHGIDRSGFSIPVAQYNDDIQTILTHEQYKKNCYKIGD